MKKEDIKVGGTYVINKPDPHYSGYAKGTEVKVLDFPPRCPDETQRVLVKVKAKGERWEMSVLPEDLDDPNADAETYTYRDALREAEEVFRSGEIEDILKAADWILEKKGAGW